MDEPPALDTERLGAYLKALASPVRLRILEALREPTRAADVRLRAGEERGGLSADRILSRPAIVQHLQVLESIGVVRRAGDRYVVDQGTMFDLVRDLGGLARIRAVRGVEPNATRAAETAAPATLPPAPRLVVLGGPEEGRGFALRGGGPWRVGRGDDCHVRVDFDPHVSRLHAEIRRAEGAYVVAGAAAAKNPVTVNFAPVPAERPALLRAGAVLGLGATRLVLQPES